MILNKGLCIFGIRLKQKKNPQRCGINLKPIYFNHDDINYVAKHILELDKHFRIRNWKITQINFE